MGWTEKLRPKELAEEDTYFAKRDRKLIDAMHRRKAAKQRSAVKRTEEKANTD